MEESIGKKSLNNKKSDMNKELEEFKNRILFKEIHHCERYSPFDEILKESESSLNWLKHKSQLESTDFHECYDKFIQIGLKVNYVNSLILLCNDLQRRGVKLQMLVATEDDYYQEQFRFMIDKAKKTMKKLRPYVVKYIEDMDDEWKQNQIEKVPGRWFRAVMKKYN